MMKAAQFSSLPAGQILPIDGDLAMYVCNVLSYLRHFGRGAARSVPWRARKSERVPYQGISSPPVPDTYGRSEYRVGRMKEMETKMCSFDPIIFSRKLIATILS